MHVKGQCEYAGKMSAETIPSCLSQSYHSALHHTKSNIVQVATIISACKCACECVCVCVCVCICVYMF